MRRRDGSPIWIDETGPSAAALARVDLRSGGASDHYDEAWLQELIHRHPAVLPTEQIEPGFGALVPVCRELPLTFGGGRSGALDNLLMTSDGGLVLVEAKLWRNPEARRSVVAQAMEYAAAVFRLTFEDLQAAVRRARSSDPNPKLSLHEIVSAGAPDLDEAEFVDAVSRNLRRGRAIVAVVGDGIREDILPLAELLQTHAGHRFTFALVELAVYAAPISGVRILSPSVLAQTALIERGVVHIQDVEGGGPRAVVTEPDSVSPAAGGATRARVFGIGEDEFFELLSQRNPELPALLKSFLARADALGVYVDRQSGLNLKHKPPSGNDLNLGTIRKDGFVDTGPATWWGRTELGRRYNQKLADMIGGFVKDMMNGEQSAVRTASGKTPRLADFLPLHEDAWLAAIEAYVREAFAPR